MVRCQRDVSRFFDFAITIPHFLASIERVVSPREQFYLEVQFHMAPHDSFRSNQLTSVLIHFQFEQRRKVEKSRKKMEFASRYHERLTIRDLHRTTSTIREKMV